MTSQHAITVGFDSFDRVDVVPFRPHWATLYNNEAALFGTALGDRLYTLTHIGSTSVPGMAGKDRLDIQMLIQPAHWSIDRLVDLIAPLGYVYDRRFDVDRHPIGSNPRSRTKWFFHRSVEKPYVNLHVRFWGNANGYLAPVTRNYLRTRPGEVRRYSAFKAGVAAAVGGERTRYSFAKQTYTDDLHHRAVRWASSMWPAQSFPSSIGVGGPAPSNMLAPCSCESDYDLWLEGDCDF